MIAVHRSKRLQKDLPRDAAEAVEQAGMKPEEIWLCTDTDLNLAGDYEQVWLVVSADALLTVGRSGRSQPLEVRVHIARKDIREIRTRQGVGGGFLQATVEGVFVDLLAYSNTEADLFHKVAGRLQPWLRGETVTLGPEDDTNPRRCPQCGMTLQFKGDVCRRCFDRGAVLLRILRLMRPYRSKAALMMGLVMAGIGLALVPQQLIRLLVDRVLAPGQAHNPVLSPEAARVWLLGLVGALLGTHLLSAVARVGMLRLTTFVGTQITYDMRERVFDRLLQLSIDYYDRYNVGQLISRVAGDTEQMKGFIQQLTGGFLQQIIMIVAVGAVLFGMNWHLTLLTLLPVPLVIVGATFFWKRVYPRYYRVWDANSKLAGVLNTILSGVRVVKAFGQEPREQRRFGRSSGYVRDSFRGVEYTVAVFNPAIGVVFQLGGLIVWFIGGQWVLGGHLTLGELLAFLGYLSMFYLPLSNLTQLTNWLTGFLTAAQRTFEILDTSVQIAESDRPVPVPEMKSGIAFENVTFGYDRHQPVLKDVSFAIAPGERIGIVGKSGSGKTTIVNLICRFYDVDEGRVLIDAVDIREMSKDDLRRQIGVVLQEPFLFRGTIYDNLTYGVREPSPEAVIEAAKAANCHDFIMRHALGYDTYVGERGAGLSGGERQRISIARALLYDPKVLILDEATSSVDTESEKLIQDALARVAAGRTTIAVAHRLSTLKNCDRILVVEGGRIIERGTHEELLAAGGTYYRLVKIQTELSRDRSVDALEIEAKHVRS